VQVGDALPEVSPDVARNLAAGMKALNRAGLRAVPLLLQGPGEMRPLRSEVAGAYVVRNTRARPPRPVRLHEFYQTFYSSGALATLRIRGRLAAWDLLSFEGDVMRVHAGQMVPGFEKYRPGRLLESWLLAKARNHLGCALVDWGEGHTESLLAMA
jgi:Acetyltransferase (GNAT) domain